MLELRSITKRLGSFVLPELSLTVNDGQYLILVGPSGVGKTVLLEIIAGLVRPDSGQILLDGKDVTNNAPEKRNIALVYQDYVLFPHMTVKQNIAYGLKAARLSSDIIENRISELSKIMEIEELLSRKPTNLSGGQQQRVALARALAVRPKLLLLDEPLSALDSNTRTRLRKVLKNIKNIFNTTVIHVTHDPDEAIQLGEQICVMLDGRIKQVGPNEELFRKPSEPDVADFLGMKNILPVSLVTGMQYSSFGQSIFISQEQESISHIWIKPEEIILSNKPFDSSARNQFICRVIEIDRFNPFFAVRISAGQMELTSLITHNSLNELNIEVGKEVYATFKSSALHCF